MSKPTYWSWLQPGSIFGLKILMINFIDKNKKVNINFNSWKKSSLDNRQPSKALKFNRQPSKSAKFNRQPSKLHPHWDPLSRATSLGFCAFLVQKLVAGCLSHAQHHVWTSKGRLLFNSQRENKPRPLISIFLKMETAWKFSPNFSGKMQLVSILPSAARQFLTVSVL